mmetsp:Transcript_83625/g.269505  ORF Transcript_83625/g.269505 Transcript_83625/m.269505 type:complete len:959 (+) Transcript_83625:1319-4195(+)
MRQDVGGLPGTADEHAEHAIRHLLLSGDSATQQDRRRLKHLVLDVQHLVDEFELALDGLVNGRDHLPRRQLRQGSQYGLHPLQHEAHGHQRGAAQHLVDEDVDVPLGRLNLRAQEGRLRAHQRLIRVRELADNAADPVAHGLQHQRALRGSVAPLLLRAGGRQQRPVGEDGLQLVLRGHVGNQRRQQTLELVRQLDQSRLGDHALHQHALLCLQREVEDQQVLDDVGLRVLLVQQRQHVLAGLEDAHELAVALVGVGETGAAHVADALQLALQVPRKNRPSMVERQLQVQGVVHAPEDAQVPLEVSDEATPVAVRAVRLGGDGPAVGSQPLFVDAVIREHLPVLRHVAVGLQKLDDGPADADVLRRGVVVQLLMPLFEVGAVDLLDLVCVHDVEDHIANLLPGVAAASHGRQCPADPHAAARVGLPQLSHPAGDLVGGAGEHPGLRASVPLPREEALEREALPHEDPTPETLRAGLNVAFAGHLHQRHGRHSGPHGLARVHMHQGVPRAELPHGHALALLLPLVYELQAILVPLPQRHLIMCHLLLHDLVGHLGPLALPATEGREPTRRIAAAPRLEPLGARGVLHNEADAGNARLDHGLAVGAFRGLGRHREVSALQVLRERRERERGGLRVHFLQTLRPCNTLRVGWARPLRFATALEHAEVQGAGAQPGVQPRTDLDLGDGTALRRVADDVDGAAIPLQLEGGERDVALALPLMALVQEGLAAHKGLLHLCRLSGLLLKPQTVPLCMAWQLKGEVVVSLLDPAVHRALVENKHEELVSLCGRDRDEGLVGEAWLVRQRRALGCLPDLVRPGRAPLHGEVGHGVHKHVHNALLLRCGGQGDDLHAINVPRRALGVRVLLLSLADPLRELARLHSLDLLRLHARLRCELRRRRAHLRRHWAHLRRRCAHLDRRQLELKVPGPVLEPLVVRGVVQHKHEELLALVAGERHRASADGPL